jgi:hypothetical protein
VGALLGGGRPNARREAAALDPSSIERPEALDWRVFISNAEIAEDAEAKSESSRSLRHA